MGEKFVSFPLSGMEVHNNLGSQQWLGNDLNFWKCYFPICETKSNMSIFMHSFKWRAYQTYFVRFILNFWNYSCNRWIEQKRQLIQSLKPCITSNDEEKKIVILHQRFRSQAFLSALNTSNNIIILLMMPMALYCQQANKPITKTLWMKIACLLMLRNAFGQSMQT